MPRGTHLAVRSYRGEALTGIDAIRTDSSVAPPESEKRMSPGSWKRGRVAPPIREQEGTMRMARGSRRVVLTLVASLLISMPALANTSTLQPVKDNTLYEPILQDAFADRSDGAGPTMFVGKVKDADADPGPGTRPAVRRGVLSFDIAGAIPAGATINSVQLTMYVDKVGLTTAFNVSLNRLLSGWGEGTSNTGNSQQGRGEPPTTNDATWHHTFYPGQFWSVPGGDYTLTASAVRSLARPSK